MARYKLTIEYDGTPYVGWQRQNNGSSVQGCIEAAAKKFCGQDVSVRGAGRTDAGVHAFGQVAHVDFAKEWPAETVRNALNAHLGQAGERIVILESQAVDDDFDARFSAIRRHYLYRILNRRVPPALQVIEGQLRSCVFPRAVALVLASQVGDGLAVRAPTWLACITSHLETARAVYVHVVDVSKSSSAYAFVGNEAYLRAVRGCVGIHLVQIRSVC